MKRRTFAQVEARAREDERELTAAKMCRVLKWHLKQSEIADKLDALMKGDEPLVQGPGASGKLSYFSGFDFITY